jgi:hypothetical protein
MLSLGVASCRNIAMSRKLFQDGVRSALTKGETHDQRAKHDTYQTQCSQRVENFDYPCSCSSNAALDWEGTNWITGECGGRGIVDRGMMDLLY